MEEDIVKRFVLIGAALAAWALPVFADDGSVLPARVLRVYAVPTYLTIPGAYDDGGKYQKDESGGGKIDAFNLGLAVEYGVTDWWGLGVQWTPGYTLASKVDLSDPGNPALGIPNFPDPKANINGPADVYVGAKFQIVGPKAPVQSDAWRFSVAPGVIIPFGALDADKQSENLANGSNVTVSDSDKHVFAYGGRGYLDYVMNKNFYVDLYGEYVQYTKASSRKVFVPSSLLAVNTSGFPGGPYTPGTNVFSSDVDFGNRITLELEPNYTLPVGGDDYGISFGLPVTYVGSAKTEYSNALAESFLGADSGYLLTVRPSADVFFYKTPFVLPVELKADYSIPVAGKNNSAVSYFDLQIRAYAQF